MSHNPYLLFSRAVPRAGNGRPLDQSGQAVRAGSCVWIKSPHWWPRYGCAAGLMESQEIVAEAGGCLVSRSGQPLSTHTPTRCDGQGRGRRTLNRSQGLCFCRVEVQKRSASDILELEHCKLLSLNPQMSHLAGTVSVHAHGPCHCAVLDFGGGQYEQERVQEKGRKDNREL